LLAYRIMLTWTVTFLLIAIFAGIFGFIAAGPAGLLLFAVFFVLFLWSMIQNRRRRDRRPASERDSSTTR
jgi:uncharacterized membrane protein YtjA (UPF0391 family)